MFRHLCFVSVIYLLMPGLRTAQAIPPDLTGLWTMQADGRAGKALNGPGDF